MNRYPTVVLASGNGSTFQAIVEQCQVAEVRALVSDKPNCYAIQRADNLGIIHHASGDRNKENLFRLLANMVEYYHPELVVLAGFMRILPPSFIDRFPRIVNIHPALLPKFKGLNTYQRALDAGEKVHGTTVHLVTEELDSGPILAQESVPILEHDTAETLQARTQEVERVLYPKVIDSIARGEIKLP